jgi:hypothetical protein
MAAEICVHLQNSLHRLRDFHWTVRCSLFRLCITFLVKFSSLLKSMRRGNQRNQKFDKSRETCEPVSSMRIDNRATIVWLDFWSDSGQKPKAKDPIWGSCAYALSMTEPIHDETY